MPPSNVSLKRSRKVPETVFFSSRRTWFRLTKPMMRLQRESSCEALLLPAPRADGQSARAGPQLGQPVTDRSVLARSFHWTDSLHPPGLEEV